MADYKLSFTAAEIDEKLGMVAQPDFEQNDENAAGYIKNRPFYDSRKIISTGDKTASGIVENTCAYNFVKVADNIDFDIEKYTYFSLKSKHYMFDNCKIRFHKNYGVSMFHDNGVLRGFYAKTQEESDIFYNEELSNYDDVYRHINITQELIEGKTYSVVYDGQVYECVAKSYNNWYVYLGNGNLKDDLPNTGEPFVIFSYEIYDTAFIAQQFEPHTISITSIENGTTVSILPETSIIMGTNPFTTGLYLYLEDAEIGKDFDVIYSFSYEDGELKDIEQKYIKDMYYDNGIIESILIEETIIRGFELMEDPLYAVQNPFTLNLVADSDYIVNFDGIEYVLLANNIYDNAFYIGNMSYIDQEGNEDCPFGIMSDGRYVVIATLSTREYHTISIKERRRDINKINAKYLDIMSVNKNVLFDDEIWFEQWDDNYYGAWHYVADCSLTIGETYDVVFDGIKYNNLICFDDYGYPSIGSAYDENFSEYPFEIFYDNEDFGIYFNIAEGIHTVSVIWHQQFLDKKYIPLNLPFMKTDKVESFNECIDGFTQWDTGYGKDIEYYGSHEELEKVFKLRVGKTYDVIFDGIQYNDLVCYSYDWGPCIGAKYYEGFSEYPFAIEMRRCATDEICFSILTSSDASEHTIVVLEDGYVIDEKYLPNINADINILQPDLSQTDESAQDFVKGVLRNEHLPEGYPYKEIVDDVIYDGIDVPFSYSSRNKIYYQMQLDCQLIVGETYVVTWDGVEYPNLVAYTDSYGWTTLGSSYDDIRNSSITKEIPFCMFISGNEEYPECDTILSGSTHNITIVHKKHVTHTIAKEFIPSGTSSWNELVDKPFDLKHLGVDAMTITWNGNPDGYETNAMDEDGRVYMCKVSDAILPLESFDGATLTTVLNGNSNTSKLKIDESVADGSLIIGAPIVIAACPVIKEIVIYAVQEDVTKNGLTLSAGVYFLGVTDESGELIAYVSKLQTVDAIRLVQIEEHFIPNSVTDVTNKLANTEIEEWIFELEDGTMITKKVVVDQ